MKARPGRKKRAGERHPCGRLRQEADRGTPELLEQRRRLTGSAEDPRASYPLGVLLARRKIMPAEHRAGRRYAALFAVAVRPARLPSILADLAGRGALASLHLDNGLANDDMRAYRAYARALAALERCGAHVLRAVEQVVVYEEPPLSLRRLDEVQTGLDALHRHFEEEDKARGVEPAPDPRAGPVA